MSRGHLASLTLTVTLALLGAVGADPAPSPKPEPRTPLTGRVFDDDTFGTTTSGTDGREHSVQPVHRPVDVPEVPLVESRVIDPAMCEPGASVAYDPLYAYRCDGGDTTCAEGEILQPPREVRRRTSPSDAWTPWEQVSGWTCVTPGTNDLEASVRSAFAEMTITPSPITVIDGRGWTFVQIDTVIYSDAEPRTLNTTVADTPVQLRATPIEWAWTFEDGTPPHRTSTPGGPWPDTSVSHVYTRTGTYTVTLTTTWQGQWRLAGDTTWRNVTGLNTTTSTSAPFTAHELRTHLVNAPPP